MKIENWKNINFTEQTQNNHDIKCLFFIVIYSKHFFFIFCLPFSSILPKFFLIDFLLSVSLFMLFDNFVLCSLIIVKINGNNKFTSRASPKIYYQ